MSAGQTGETRWQRSKFNFGGIRAAEKATETANIAIRGLLGMRPVLVCRPATKATPAYFNKILKRQRIGRGRIDVTVKNMDEWLADDVNLLSEHCVVGFVPGTVVDADGNELPFSVDACKALLGAVYAEDQKMGTTCFEDFCADIRDPASFSEAVDPDSGEGTGGKLAERLLVGPPVRSGRGRRGTGGERPCSVSRRASRGRSCRPGSDRDLLEDYEAEPEISEVEAFYFEAFNHLSTCRTVGMGAGPIPWHVIVDYGARFGLDDEEVDALVVIIFAMDNAWLSWQGKNKGKGEENDD